MLLSAVSVLVVAQSSSEIPEGLMNNPVQCFKKAKGTDRQTASTVLTEGLLGFNILEKCTPPFLG